MIRSIILLIFKKWSGTALKLRTPALKPGHYFLQKPKWELVAIYYLYGKKMVNISTIDPGLRTLEEVLMEI